MEKKKFKFDHFHKFMLKMTVLLPRNNDIINFFKKIQVEASITSFFNYNFIFFNLKPQLRIKASFF